MPKFGAWRSISSTARPREIEVRCERGSIPPGQPCSKFRSYVCCEVRGDQEARQLDDSRTEAGHSVTFPIASTAGRGADAARRQPDHERALSASGCCYSKEQSCLQPLWSALEIWTRGS